MSWWLLIAAWLATGPAVVIWWCSSKVEGPCLRLHRGHHNALQPRLTCRLDDGSIAHAEIHQHALMQLRCRVPLFELFRPLPPRRDLGVIGPSTVFNAGCFWANRRTPAALCRWWYA